MVFDLGDRESVDCRDFTVGSDEEEEEKSERKTSRVTMNDELTVIVGEEGEVFFGTRNVSSFYPYV